MKTRIVLLLSLAFPYAQAGMLNLPQSPIALSNPVPPNVFFLLDDSGSMDWEYLGKPAWEGCAYDPNFTGKYSSTTVCGSQWSGDPGLPSYGNGQFLNFNYIYNGTTNAYNTYNPSGCDYSDNSIGINAIEGCPEAGTADWRFFSADQNQMYYDPDNTYTPWIAYCSSKVLCANATFTMVREYPVSNEKGYSSTRNLSGFTYHVWIDNRGFTGARPLRASAVNVTNSANGIVDLWDSHVSIQVTPVAAIITSINYTPNSSSLQPLSVVKATLTGGGCFDALGPSSYVASMYKGSLSWTAQGDAGCRTIAQVQQNVANWYQYSRKRHMAAKGVLAYIISQSPNNYYGLTTINNNLFIPVPAAGADLIAQNNNIINSLITYDWKTLGTPNRTGLNTVGRYFQNNLSGQANPIIAACQQNYAILMTDGYWNDTTNINSSIGDTDGDGISQTLADIAYYFYNNNLQSSWPSNQLIPNSWDPATWLHLVTFSVGFGVVGNLTPGNNGWPNPPLAINADWGNPFTTQTAKADDMWHAAFNSKGSYVLAQNPTSAAQALINILANISQRIGSYSNAAQNSSVLNTDSEVYQATITGSMGDLKAFSIDTSGQLATLPSWSASCMLTGGPCALPPGTNAAPGATNRAIITRNWTGANNGVAFRWPSNYTTYMKSGSLPTNMANFLTNAPYASNTIIATQITANQAYGQALLNYLRGDQSQEMKNNGTYLFRNRSGLLGDIINSSPEYVPAPNRIYPDTLQTGKYSAFKSANASRKPVVYVGANDGMLHGFNADTGAEILAYIPGVRQIYQNLPNLSLPMYTHNFFVDGSPTEADVYINNAWQTILVGSLQNGGQGVYGLNITDPANFTENNASSIYLFEFTDQDDPDLGYIQGNILVGLIPVSATQTQWAVIFGNGYNNSQADGYASTTGKAALYILLPGLFSGSWVLNSNYYKIPVGSGSVVSPNGLSAPFLVDMDSDYIVDYIYAGDLQGNLWKFNLTSKTPAVWSSAASLLFTAQNAAAGDQPITAAPVVGAHPTGVENGLMVYFGTGQLLQNTDNTATGQTTQSFYAIWDQLSTKTVTKSQLLQQQILGEAIGTSGSTYRLVTTNPISWTTTPGPQYLGWYLNLMIQGASTNYGERAISQPILRNNNVIFTSFLPSSNNCLPGGSSWLMELSSTDGGTPKVSPFDTDNSGTFTTEDYITLTLGGRPYKQPASGVKSKVGMTGKPAIYLSPNKKIETKVMSGSQGLGTLSENPASGPSGRQNWRQIQ